MGGYASWGALTEREGEEAAKSLILSLNGLAT